ncbi:murein transglycosylase A [Defluviimonas sp. SAOS-178_SWC]|uniref:murein transglycosylase A n=1 Tax=Defluviimonas sp. SAOS-178_SWC TaxID=3121287 RepID=UPI0032219C01
METARRLAFSRLAGWAVDDHAAALAVYAVTADQLGPDWPRPDGGDPRAFFERHFCPILTGTPPALLTGYYEPEILGADALGGAFQYPLYAQPDDLPADRPWHTRAEIEAGDLLRGRELVWLNSPVEAFFAQVQGSVRVHFSDGRIRRFGFAGRNGHEYRSIGAELIRRGEIAASEMTADAIRDWCARFPERVEDLLRCNPSFVFFRALDLPDGSGPLGCMGRPVTEARTLAVDPEFIPLGAPVWVEAGASGSLMVAQDQGSAIKGAQRGDIFCGSGPAAGERAGTMHVSGRLVTFLPRALAERIAP